MQVRPGQFGNTRVEIELRKTDAELSRETQRLRKNCLTLKRQHGQNMRKLGSVQRGLLMLVGKDPYPDCTRENALFEYNQPGFCYKKNGKPRCMKTLQESTTRRIVSDMAGREGLQSDPAINVVSDTPMMAEVLSSPEIVQILCELRNTAALMSDENLFTQFALALAKSNRNTLVGFEGPMDYLKQYRRNLIQEFFDTLKMEAEMRFMMVQDDPTMSFFKQPTSKVVTPGSAAYVSKSSSAVGLNNAQNLTMEQWNQAVMESLRKAQEEEIKEHCPNDQELQKESLWTLDEVDETTFDRATQWRIQRQMLGLAGVPSLYSSRAIGFDKYLEENRRERNQKLKSQTKSKFHHIDQPAELIFAKPSNDKPKKSVVILAPNIESRVLLGSARSDRRVTFHPETKDQSRRQQRKEFDNFVRQLIAKIEVLDEMGRGLLTFQKKRPTKHEHITNPLMKLLKKQSLFSSLTDDDVLFYEFEGGRKGVEELLAQQLGANLPRPGGGFTYKVPTPAHGTESSDFANGTGLGIPTGGRSAENIRSAGSGSGSRGRRPTLSIYDSEGFGYNRGSTAAPSTSCARCDQVSMKKVCCSACREKVRLACEKMQERDKLCTIAKTGNYWRVPEIHMWPRQTRAQIEALRPSMGESLNSRNLDFMKENRSKSVYLIPPPTSVEFRKGAPTPRFPRNSMLPGTGSAEQSSSVTFVPGRYASTGFASQGKLLSYLDESTTKSKRPHSQGSGLNAFDTRSSSATPAPVADLSSTSMNSQPPQDSWTLKVSKMDIMRLRHELETDTVKDKMAKFEERYLKSL